MKHTWSFKILVICSLVLVVKSSIYSQSSKLYYTASDAEIANPERGWYSHTQTTESYFRLSTETLRQYREQDNVTLILRLFYLKNHIDEDVVSDDYKINMQADFDSIRAAGIKCIVRFAYSSSMNASVYDAIPAKVLSQIESLKDVLHDNSDVIVAIQAGFVGAWGEWYFTHNFAGDGFSPTEEDQVNRRAIFESLLDVLPEHVVVQGRTPAIMKNAVLTEEPVSAQEAFSGTRKSRVGHHNDCFAANDSDRGTYTDLQQDLKYLHETTKYTIAGGETCDDDYSTSDCDNSVPRMKLLHWTYLNRDYHQGVIGKWEDQGCFDEVNLSLGYRIQLDSAVFNDSTAGGQVYPISLSFTNTGFAAPTQYKPIQIVFTNALTNVTTRLPYVGMNDDIRYWLPGTFSIDGFVHVPAELAEGDYTLSLRFPDQSPRLEENPAYSIRLANIDTWVSDKGENDLNFSVTISDKYIDKVPASPTELTVTAVSDSEVTITWQDNSDDESGFEIWRSKGNANMMQRIAKLPAELQVYVDEGLEKSTIYFYSVKSISEFGPSTGNEIASDTTFRAAPAAPTNLNALVVSSSRVRLTWDDNSDDEESFIIESANLADNLVAIDTVDKNLTEVYLDDLSANTLYTFRVYASNTTGISDHSNEVAAATKPSSLADKLGSDIGVELYPNPVRDFLYVENISDKGSLEVMNIAGNVVLKTNLEDKIDLSGLTKGLYFLKLSVGGNSYVYKILKQ